MSAFMKKHHVAQNCPGCFHLPERFMCDCLLGHTYSRMQWRLVYFSSFELPLGPLLCSYMHSCWGGSNTMLWRCTSGPTAEAEGPPECWKEQQYIQQLDYSSAQFLEGCCLPPWGMALCYGHVPWGFNTSPIIYRKITELSSYTTLVFIYPWHLFQMPC